MRLSLNGVLRSLSLSAIVLFGVQCTDDKKLDEAVGKDGKVTAPGFSEAELKAQTVYFPFDSSAITDENQSRVSTLAEQLNKNAAAKITVEGHCDNRGTAQYNLALGERRAYAVKKYLMQLGVSEDRINTVSYGEERPAVEGNNEEAWAKNRRAEFVAQ